MSLDQLLLFYTENIHLIIQSLVTLILLLLLLFAWRVFFSKSKSSELKTSAASKKSEPTVQAQAVEEVLTPIDKDSRVQKETSSAGGTDFVAQVQKMHNEMAGLKAEIEERNLTIKNLKTEVEAKKVEKSEAAVAGGGGDDELARKLQERINELEEKLAEYEIIEDDIADLSFFKSEVSRLQALVDKQGGAAAPEAKQAAAGGGDTAELTNAPAAEKPEEIVPEAAADEEVIEPTEDVEEPAAPEAEEEEEEVAAVNEDVPPASEEVATEVDNPAPEETIAEESTAQAESVAEEPQEKEQGLKVEDDPVASTQRGQSAEEDGEKPPVAPSPIVNEEEEVSEAELDEDLLAEFAAAVGEDGTPEGEGATDSEDELEASPIDGELDLDKMASEASEILSEVENEEELDVNALKSEIDPEKLAEEAFAMAQAAGDQKDKNDSE